MKAEEVVRWLGLEPHPKGGYFREIYRAPGEGRTAATSIYFLLESRAIALAPGGRAGNLGLPRGRAANPHFSPGSRPASLSRRSLRKERAEKRSGAYGRGPRRRGRAPGRDPEGGAVGPAGCVDPLARCPATCAHARQRTMRFASFLPCRPDSTAQTMTLVRSPG